MNGEVEDYLFTGFDYGDLPAAYNNTQNSDNGARHQISNLYLGATVDPEIEGKESVLVNGDDVNDGLDDEDGINIPNVGTWGDGIGSVDVTVTGGTACIVGWADYNNDGDFADTINDGVATPTEQIFTTQLSAGTTSVNFPTPRSVTGGGTYVYPSALNFRFRLFHQNDPLFVANSLTLTGGCPNPSNTTAAMATITVGLGTGGEVEDYQKNFSPLAITFNKTSANTINYGWLFLGAVVGVIYSYHNFGKPQKAFPFVPDERPPQRSATK